MRWLTTLLALLLATPAWAVDFRTGGVTSLTGTANQVIVDVAAGAVTLSLPQDIAAASTPTFGGLTLNGTLAMGANNITGTGTVNAGTLIVQPASGNTYVETKRVDNTADNGVVFIPLSTVTAANPQWFFGVPGGVKTFQIYAYNGGSSPVALSIATNGVVTLPSGLVLDATVSSTNSALIVGSGYSLTGSSAVSMVSLAGTLNTSGVVDVWKLVNTTTAAGAGSNAMAVYGGGAGATALMLLSTGGTLSIGAAPATALAKSLYMSGVAFANLGTPSDGSLIFCTDCDPPTLVDSTCTSAAGKTGSLAFRVNGAWKCIS